MALIVLDASVVIGHLDPADAHHEAAVTALLSHAADDLRLPASAYSETLVGPARKGRAHEAREKIKALSILIEPLTEEMAERASALRAKHRALRLPDALVLACGDALSADLVLTTDHRWSRWSKRAHAFG